MPRREDCVTPPSCRVEFDNSTPHNDIGRTQVILPHRLFPVILTKTLDFVPPLVPLQVEGAVFACETSRSPAS